VLRAGRVLTGIVSCEVIWVSREIVRRVRKALKRLGVPNADQVLFCANAHTHTGPYTRPLLRRGARRELHQQLVDKIALATRRAYANLAPASF